MKIFSGIIFITIILLQFNSSAQVNRKPQTPSKAASIPALQQPKKDTVLVRGVRPVKAQEMMKIKPAGRLFVADLLPPINFKRFVSYVGSDPDVKPSVWVEEYNSGELKYITNQGQTPQWQSDFVWMKIPVNAVSARVEIASLPFSSDADNNFNSILETRMISKTKADSVKFNISFKEKPAGLMPVMRNSTRTPIQNLGLLKFANTKSLMDALKNYGTYYVRLVPLDANGGAIGMGGNMIKIVPEYLNFPKPPIPTSEDSLQSDYEITSVNYTQMHEPEYQFSNCTVVMSYNESTQTGPLGNNWEKDMINTFKTAFPIGKIICPSPPKSPSWYESAFNSVTDAAALVVNGASKVYNETRDYVKTKFSEYLCNYDPVISSNKKLLEETGMSKQQVQSGCEFASGVVFETAMTYAGMPPSLPNFDEMCQLAKGQVVQMLIQKAVEQTGMPCDENCAALIEKELSKKIEESAKKNMVNGGFFNYKPDPRGQYRSPYVEIEITRKRNSQKGGKIFTNLFFTPGVEKTFSLNDKNGKPYTTNISSNEVYEKIQLLVPYLKNVGDKIKLVAVLTPKFAFVNKHCTDGRIISIDPKQHLCLGFNTIETPGEDPKNSSGYSMMVEKAAININPSGKIKLSAGVNTKFIHHQ